MTATNLKFFFPNKTRLKKELFDSPFNDDFQISPCVIFNNRIVNFTPGSTYTDLLMQN